MKSHKKFSFYIIGGGRAGASLAYFFLEKGYSIISLVEKNSDRRRFLKDELGWTFVERELNQTQMSSADIFLLTVQDDQITQLTLNLTDLNLDWNHKICLHCSGYLPSSILLPLKERGAKVASLHPIYSFFVDPRKNKYLDKAGFSLEGDKSTFGIIEKIFRTSSNKIFRVDENRKKEIHLASVFYANFYVSLAKQCAEILQPLGWPEKQIFEMLNPLLFSSIKQVTEFGHKNALTGPVKRGDVETLRSHLTFLKKNHPALVSTYITMSEQLIKISELPDEARQRISSLLLEYQS